MTLNIKMKGMDRPVQVSGSTFEENETDLCVKDKGGKVIARFSRAGLIGWWPEERYEPTEEDMKSARESLEKIRRLEQDA